MIQNIFAAVGAFTAENASVLMLLAKATIILLAALAMTVVMRRASAGTRHLVWLVTLATLLIVPALAAWAPLRMAILPAAPVDARAVQPPLEPVSLPAPAATETRPSSSPAPVPLEAATPRFLDGVSTITLMAWTWIAVFLAIAAWLGWGAFAVRRIVSNAHALDTSDWLTPLYEISDRLGLETPPTLLGSTEAKMPFACGFTSATIVLPADCEDWTLDRRKAVLLHELAHVKRRDLVGHTLGRIACALYWFHPLVWTAAKQLRNESERACDDLALSCGARASDYAEHLLDIVTSVRQDATPAVALAMARRKEFEGRMLAILDPDLRHSSPSRIQSAALVGSLVLIAIVVGAAAPAPREAIAKSAPEGTAAAPAQDPAALEDGRIELQSDAHTPSPPALSDARVLGPDESKKVETEEEKTGLPVTSAIANVIANATVKATEQAIADAASTSRDIIAELFTAPGGGEKTVAAADERPGLLANILRTEKEPTLRRTAAWGLSEYTRYPVAVEALVHAVRRDSDERVREMAAWALSDARRNSVGAAALVEALRSDASVKVRSIAAWSLGNIGDHDAVPALVAALSDENRSLRARAAWAIGNIEPREAPAGLVALLRDSDPALRQLAAWALYRIEDPSSAGALNAALKAETRAELKLDYIRALAQLGEKSVDAIRELLLSSDPKIKSIAVSALAGGMGVGPWPWPWPEPRPTPH